jgi:CheY-like chemotaxis protein
MKLATAIGGRMRKKLILLVEDTPDEVKLTEIALKKIDIPHDLVVAKDGVEALNYLYGIERHDDHDTGIKPHVILLDLNMPRMGGLEVLQKIRTDERTKFYRVVVLTTSGEDKDRIASYRLGANSYIRKPNDYHQFVAALTELSHYWLVLNEAP